MVDNFSLWVEMSLKIIRSIGVHNEWKSSKINCQVMKYLEVKIARNSITQKVEDNINTFLNCDDIISSWKDKFLLKGENRDLGEIGLRNPQIGAIYAILAHWSYSNEVGTVAMSTETAKTETMLSVLVKEQIKEHKFLFNNESQVINFWGKYFYDFEFITDSEINKESPCSCPQTKHK
ncbi:hypothetical protein CLU83_0485 [Flavobacterium sp. 1]|nr:hypothetical protein CLU83_0485 [Flavobacterium sp. 1]